MDYRNREFENEDVVLDGNTFSGCTFRKCRLIFKATAPVGLGHSKLVDCQWSLGGAAALTISFLTALYGAGDPDSRRVVEGTIENIRKGKGRKTGDSFKH